MHSFSFISRRLFIGIKIIVVDTHMFQMVIKEVLRHMITRTDLYNVLYYVTASMLVKGITPPRPTAPHVHHVTLRWSDSFMLLLKCVGENKKLNLFSDFNLLFTTLLYKNWIWNDRFDKRENIKIYSIYDTLSWPIVGCGQAKTWYKHSRHFKFDIRERMHHLMVLFRVCCKEIVMSHLHNIRGSIIKWCTSFPFPWQSRRRGRQR
jgi:hypothetical protein